MILDEKIGLSLFHIKNPYIKWAYEIVSDIRHGYYGRVTHIHITNDVVQLTVRLHVFPDILTGRVREVCVYENYFKNKCIQVNEKIYKVRFNYCSLFAEYK
jgi:hypothetical protein